MQGDKQFVPQSTLGGLLQHRRIEGSLNLGQGLGGETEPQPGRQPNSPHDSTRIFHKRHWVQGAQNSGLEVV